MREKIYQYTRTASLIIGKLAVNVTSSLNLSIKQESSTSGTTPLYWYTNKLRKADSESVSAVIAKKVNSPSPGKVALDELESMSCNMIEARVEWESRYEVNIDGGTHACELTTMC